MFHGQGTYSESPYNDDSHHSKFHNLYKEVYASTLHTCVNPTPLITKLRVPHLFLEQLFSGTSDSPFEQSLSRLHEEQQDYH